MTQLVAGSIARNYCEFNRLVVRHDAAISTTTDTVARVIGNDVLNVNMSAGYLYVLANSSMPGLVKVGRTSRLPSERADELSGVTGVPTPFIVVYEAHFQDCEAAECFVHTELAQNGMRISDCREFFRASPSDVVKVVSAAENSVKLGRIDQTTSSDDWSPREDSTRQPWDDLIRQADDCYYGSSGCIQDYAEALRIYRSAARLGCPRAYSQLGRIYRKGGSGVRKNLTMALECLKQGAKLGDYFSHAEMAFLFVETRHTANIRTAVCNFVRTGEAEQWASDDCDLHITYMDALATHLYYSRDTYRQYAALVHELAPILRPYADKLISKYRSRGNKGDIVKDPPLQGVSGACVRKLN